MRCPSAIVDEKGRLLALAEYGLEEEQVLPNLEPVVHIAARMLDMPVAAVNMIGSDHVFFAASFGISECDMSRDVSFCAHAITQNDVMVVLDATLDWRFHDNPLVTGSAGVRFYAGVPLRAPSGHALGALCVIDSRPRSSFSQQDQERLKDLASLASDKLELRRLEVATRGDSFRFEDIAANSPTAILCLDRDQIVTFWNSAAAAMFGYSISEIVGRPLSTLMPVIDDHPSMEIVESVLRSGLPSFGGSVKQTLGLRKDFSAIQIELSLFNWKQAGREHFGAMLTDVTERGLHKDQLQRLANFDSLTGLANRGLLQRRVAEELSSGSAIAVIAIDLGNFKDVNDTLGNSIGDQVLSTVADRLLRCVRPVDTVSRISGDEFAILLPQIGDALQPTAVAEAVIAAISRPILLEDLEVRVDANCGVAIAPAHGQTAEELIGNADLALYQAKKSGRGRSFVFIPSLREKAIERRMFDAELHRAVETGQFELFYQPQIRISDGLMVGAEALMRWRHPERGYLPPDTFLPALEGSSLAGIIGTWVLETACAQAAKWRRAGGLSLRIGVNLFAAQFLANDLTANVANAMERHQIPPDALELEITENIILNQDEFILEQLQHLRSMGVRIAFDDFGTGYASLSLLKNYPLTRIKIDRTFISSMCASLRDEAMVAAAVALARNYDLEVIAEGVETDEQVTKLLQLECDEAQGYFYGKPMAVDQFSELLKAS